MSDITLYGCPKACSFVSHIALEMTGAPFNYEFVDLFKGQQRSAAFLSLTQRGRVPILVADGRSIAETVAILQWLAAAFPDARLLPAAGTDLHIQAMSDLAWFSSGVHPIMTRMLVPARFVETKVCQAALQLRAVPALADEFAIIEARLSDRDWWFGDLTSLDGYLFWIWARSGEGRINLSPYPRFARHAQRMLSIRAVRHALNRERLHLPCFDQLASILPQ